MATPTEEQIITLKQAFAAYDDNDHKHYIYINNLELPDPSTFSYTNQDYEARLTALESNQSGSSTPNTELEGKVSTIESVLNNKVTTASGIDSGGDKLVTAGAVSGYVASHTPNIEKVTTAEEIDSGGDKLVTAGAVSGYVDAENTKLIPIPKNEWENFNINIGAEGDYPTDITFGQNKFVICMCYQSAYSEDDGKTWHAGNTYPYTIEENYIPASIAYGNDRFVILTYNSRTSSSASMYSPDGITWHKGPIVEGVRFSSMIFIHNLSDTEILDNGSFAVASDVSSNISTLQDKITAYARINSLSVEYMMDTETKDIKLICNGTGLLFYMTDNYGIKNKYVAYYLETDRQYYICRGGFFYCTLLSALTVTLDCKNLGVYDSLDRPVLYTDIGIQDEDEIYWMRLVYGNNSIRAMGNFKLSATYLEPRKGLLI